MSFQGPPGQPECAPTPPFLSTRGMLLLALHRWVLEFSLLNQTLELGNSGTTSCAAVITSSVANVGPVSLGCPRQLSCLLITESHVVPTSLSSTILAQTVRSSLLPWSLPYCLSAPAMMNFNIMVTGHLLPQTASHLPAPSGLETCYGKIFWFFFLTNCFPDCYVSALSLWCPVTASEWWWRSLELLDTVYKQPGRKSRVGVGRLIVSSRPTRHQCIGPNQSAGSPLPPVHDVIITIIFPIEEQSLCPSVASSFSPGSFWRVETLSTLLMNRDLYFTEGRLVGIMVDQYLQKRSCWDYSLSTPHAGNFPILFGFLWLLTHVMNISFNFNSYVALRSHWGRWALLIVLLLIWFHDDLSAQFLNLP